MGNGGEPSMVSMVSEGCMCRWHSTGRCDGHPETGTLETLETGTRRRAATFTIRAHWG